MTENETMTRRQLISKTIEQHKLVAKLQRGKNKAFEDICLRLDEEDLFCDGTTESDIKRVLGEHQICQIPVHQVDALGSIGFVIKTYYCPFYDQEHGCTNSTKCKCENYTANQNYLEAKQLYETEKRTKKNMIRQIFGLKEKHL